MTPVAEQVRQLISHSQAILSASMIAELSRAITCCRIAKLKSNGDESLRYLMVGEATSAKFMKLRAQGQVVESHAILNLMVSLEEELGGRLYTN